MTPDELEASIVERYPYMHAGDRAILREACYLLRQAHLCDEHVEEHGVVVEGARRNWVANPALQAGKQLRVAFSAMMKRLDLEYDEEEMK